jgi:hypothetical protein
MTIEDNIVALFAALMLDLAGYFFLKAQWNRAPAALGVAGGDLVIALLLLLATRFCRRTCDLQAAQRLRRSAVDALIADAAALEAEWLAFKDSLRHPVGEIQPMLVRLLRLALRARRRAQAKSPQPTSSG